MTSFPLGLDFGRDSPRLTLTLGGRKLILSIDGEIRREISCDRLLCLIILGSAKRVRDVSRFVCAHKSADKAMRTVSKKENSARRAVFIIARQPTGNYLRPRDNRASELWT